MRKAKRKLSAKKKLERELEWLRRSCTGLRSERIKREADLEEAKATISRAKEARKELESNLTELSNVKRLLVDVNAELNRRRAGFKPYQASLCRNCKFFFPAPADGEDCPECHLNPPAGSGWPKLPDDDEWCGRFEAR